MLYSCTGGAAVPESELVSENTSVCVREVISPISQQEGEDATVSHNGADENKEEMQAVSAPGGRGMWRCLCLSLHPLISYTLPSVY